MKVATADSVKTKIEGLIAQANEITGNTDSDLTTAVASLASGYSEPIEISTDAGMEAVLTSSNVGKVYKFTGISDTYTNGDLYVVEEVG